MADRFEQAVTERMRQLTGQLPAGLRTPVDTLVHRPGKRLRSALLLACAAAGRADPDRLRRLGAVVELLHIASLLHDDVVDRSAQRRGTATAHVVVGQELALLAGLAAFALVGAEAAELGPGVSKAVGVTVSTLAYGQMLDLERAFDTDLTVADYLELVTGKTASLFRLCCVLGAVEARAEPDVVAAVGTFGAEFGTAFQVVDDCVDFEPAGSGKPAGTDQLLGLYGAPTLLALRADDSGALREQLLATEPAEPGVLRTRIIDLGGVDRARELAGEHRERALAALDGVPHDRGRAALVAVLESLW